MALTTSSLVVNLLASQLAVWAPRPSIQSRSAVISSAEGSLAVYS